MQEKDIVPEHSVLGYLRRRSTEELETMLNYYLQEDMYENYSNVILEILAILEERFVPEFTSEQYVRAKELLLKYDKRDSLKLIATACLAMTTKLQVSARVDRPAAVSKNP